MIFVLFGVGEFVEKMVVVGNVCFLQDKRREKVLLLHRNNEPMQHMSTGVGGKTEFHEDIHLSCHREVFEETGFVPINMRLKGILKTIEEGGNSSWILFVYTAETFSDEIHPCNEGTLEWVPLRDLHSRNIIGFIRLVLPYVLDDTVFFEGTVVHDVRGNVLSDTIKLYT
jgi:8-oxo-dGTP diphosphatase